MFTKRQNSAQMRGSRNGLIEPKCNFGWYYKSSIPYLARLLNRVCQNSKKFEDFIPKLGLHVDIHNKLPQKI